jgi:hypothetical protein
MLEQNDIRLELIAKLAPDYQVDNFSINALADQARQIFERKIMDVHADRGAMEKGKKAQATVLKVKV